MSAWKMLGDARIDGHWSVNSSLTEINNQIEYVAASHAEHGKCIL